MDYISDPCATRNTELAAALSACGIPLNKKVPVRKFVGDRGDLLIFYFESQSPCGLYKTQELVKAWDNKEWHRKNPEHPFAYIKCAFQNRARLVDHAKRRVPIAAVEQGSKIAFLSLNSSDALQKRVFTELKK